MIRSTGGSQRDSVPLVFLALGPPDLETWVTPSPKALGGFWASSEEERKDRDDGHPCSGDHHDEHHHGDAR
jgi:hypothetical protein